MALFTTLLSLENLIFKYSYNLLCFPSQTYLIVKACEPKGPYTHDEEFAYEYSTNIRRRRIDHFNIIFLRKSIFLKFLDLLVGFRKFYI